MLMKCEKMLNAQYCIDVPIPIPIKKCILPDGKWFLIKLSKGKSVITFVLNKFFQKCFEFDDLFQNFIKNNNKL